MKNNPKSITAPKCVQLGRTPSRPHWELGTYGRVPRKGQEKGEKRKRKSEGNRENGLKGLTLG